MTVPVRTSDGLPDSTVTAAPQSMVFGQPGSVPVDGDPVGGDRDGDAQGRRRRCSGRRLSTAARRGRGAGRRSLPVGDHKLTLVYSGDSGFTGSRGDVVVTVEAATPSITATPTPASVEVNSGTSSIAVAVAATGVDPGGEVTATVDGRAVDSQRSSAGPRR